MILKIKMVKQNKTFELKLSKIFHITVSLFFLYTMTRIQVIKLTIDSNVLTSLDRFYNATEVYDAKNN